MEFQKILVNDNKSGEIKLYTLNSQVVNEHKVIESKENNFYSDNSYRWKINPEKLWMKKLYRENNFG